MPNLETPMQRAARLRAADRPDLLKQGYTVGTEPVPPRRQIGQESAPLGLSAGAVSSAEKERRRREKVARGEQLDQSDL